MNDQARTSQALVAVVLASLLVLPTATEGRRKKAPVAENANDLLIVDCLLPHKTRRLGRQATFLVPRKPLRTTAIDCRIRGGEYTAPDQATYATALAVWRPQADAGDAEAQFYVGQIYEKGLGAAPADYAAAAEWYRKAAEQGDASAAVALGYLHEEGLGVEQDDFAALNWYRRAAGLAEDLVVLEAGEYADLVAAQQSLETKTEEMELLKREIEALREQLKTLESQSADDQAREASLQSILDRLQADLEARRKEVSDQRARVAALEQRVPGALPLAPGTTAPSDEPILFGKYHALVIGNQGYRDLPEVAGAIDEAKLVAGLLREKYGFEVTLLLDATRYQIMTALNELRETLTQDYDLLVYYAGHGTRDADGHTAYWQPIDAAPENPANWIPNEVVTEHLDVVPARHVLVVADSVYSGLRTRSSVAQLRAGMTQEERHYHIRLLLERRSRLVLASGRRSPGGESDTAPTFAKTFVDVLRANDDVLEASEVYRRLNTRFAASEAAAPDLEFAPMRWARNDLADFFFVPAAKRSG